MHIAQYRKNTVHLYADRKKNKKKSSARSNAAASGYRISRFTFDFFPFS
jgi:hypothetical protein